MDDREVERENRRWVQRLRSTGSTREAAAEELYAVLLRVARSEARRRAPLLRLDGPELSDVAHQAAADALMAITDRLDTFRGESRFTTWACRFAILNVATKMNRHFWRHHDIPYEQDEWSRVASGRPAPDEELLASDFGSAVTAAVEQHLSQRQRVVFVSTVLEGTPVEIVARELGSTHNAIYKVLFDARKKLRTALTSGGYLSSKRQGPKRRDTVLISVTDQSDPQ